MVDAQEIFHRHFPDSQWKIEDPHGGLSTQAFIANNGQEKVFLKFDVRSSTLKRLSELEVTPPVLFEGASNNRPVPFSDMYWCPGVLLQA